MERIITWKSFDGKTFDSETDCMRHEDKLKEEMYSGEAIFLDSDFNTVGISSIQDIFVIHISTFEARDWVITWMDEHGYDFDGLDVGTYIYSNENYESRWLNVDAQIETLKKIKERCTKIMSQIQEKTS